VSTASRRAAAIAAVLSAVTTFLLWLLPRLYEAPQGFEETLRLHQNGFYLGRLWVNFIHIFLALAAYGGAAAVLWRRSPGLAGYGLISFLLWGFVELVGVAINIFAVNATWRAQFSTATPEVQERLRVLLLGFPSIWDAMFFVLLVGFLFGTTCCGLAALPGKGLERWVGILFLLGTPLTIAIMIGEYTSLTVLNKFTGWTYPFLQPVSRALLGVWLWRTGAGGAARDPS
jgi:hypothetical protein